eukprot:2958556-Rhodomonas_salina.1
MHETCKLCDLQAQLKKAGVLDAKGNFKGPADTLQASNADCPCRSCQRCNCNVKDCFERPENASKRPNRYKICKQHDKERTLCDANYEEDDDDDDEGPAVVSVTHAWSIEDLEEPTEDGRSSYSESDELPPLEDPDSSTDDDCYGANNATSIVVKAAAALPDAQALAANAAGIGLISNSNTYDDCDGANNVTSIIVKAAAAVPGAQAADVAGIKLVSDSIANNDCHWAIGREGLRRRGIQAEIQEFWKGERAAMRGERAMQMSAVMGRVEGEESASNAEEVEGGVEDSA